MLFFTCHHNHQIHRQCQSLHIKRDDDGKEKSILFCFLYSCHMWNVKSNTNFIPSFLQNTNVLMIIRWQWRNIVIASITFQQVLKAVQTVTQAKSTNKTFLYYVLMDFWRALKFEIQVHFVYELSTRVVLPVCLQERPCQSQAKPKPHSQMNNGLCLPLWFSVFVWFFKLKLVHFYYWVNESIYLCLLPIYSSSTLLLNINFFFPSTTLL